MNSEPLTLEELQRRLAEILRADAAARDLTSLRLATVEVIGHGPLIEVRTRPAPNDLAGERVVLIGAEL